MDFADIGDFIHQPVKTYSSGMLVRLAFAVAVNIDPEILIVDEALSVGDIRFQQKCYRKIREFKENGTVLFVSHDTGAISSFCDRVIWLDDGKIYKEGEPGEIIEEYLSFMRYDIRNDEKGEIFGDAKSSEQNENNTFSLDFGTEEAWFTKIRLLNEKNELVSEVYGGDTVVFDMRVMSKKRIDLPIFGFNIKDVLGNELVVTNTFLEECRVEPIEPGKEYNFQWKFRFPELHAGDYPIDIALAEGTYAVHSQLHFATDALVVKVIDDRNFQEGRGKLVPRGIRFIRLEH